MTVLIRRGRVLLAHRRAERRWYPDCWDLVGGHLEPGESPEQAARRECREEIDADVVALHPVEVGLDDSAIEAHAFLVTSWRGEPRNAAPEEHDALGWFSAEDLPILRLAYPSYVAWLTGLLASTRSASRALRAVVIPSPSAEKRDVSSVGDLVALPCSMRQGSPRKRSVLARSRSWTPRS